MSENTTFIIENQARFCKHFSHFSLHHHFILLHFFYAHLIFVSVFFLRHCAHREAVSHSLHRRGISFSLCVKRVHIFISYEKATHRYIMSLTHTHPFMFDLYICKCSDIRTINHNSIIYWK